MSVSVKKNRQLRSLIWNFFTPDLVIPHLAFCNICRQKFSHKTSTSNLKKHMTSKHPLVSMNCVTDPRKHLSLENEMETDDVDSQECRPIHLRKEPTPLPSTSSASQIQLLQTAPNPPTIVNNLRPIAPQKQQIISHFIPRKVSVCAKKKMDDKLMLLFTKDFQPFSVVDDKGFKEFVKVLNPSYDLPTRQVISKTLIPAKFEECLYSTKNKIACAVSVCLTTDCWTSVNNESFMAVTAHFINEMFELECVLLKCAQFSGHHTGLNLAESLREVVSDFNLENKIILTVSDNASNIKNAIQQVLQWRYFGCFAHSLNLIVKSALEINSTISNLLTRVRSVVSHFKRSTTSNEKFLTYQENNNPSKKKLKLIQDISTRWNSTFYMLERFTTLEEAVKATVALIGKDVPCLTPEEWQIAHELVHILKPFEAVTKVVSGEKYATASIVIPLTLGLRKVCSDLLLKNNSVPVKDVCQKLNIEVQERFGNIESSKTLILTTFLDPRFKNAVFSDQRVADTAKDRAVSLVTAIIAKDSSSQSTTEEAISSSSSEQKNKEEGTLSAWCHVDTCVALHKPKGTNTSRAIIEVNRYLEDDIIPRQEDPLQWWKCVKYNYPFLSKVVQKYLCAVSTSVPCERVFSKAGNILTEKRNRLSGNKAKMLMFLNSNS